MKPMSTLLLLCPVCGSDAADTLGVTGRLEDPLDATVVMLCDDCGTAYLSPAPSLPAAATDRAADSPEASRQIRRWTKGTKPTSSILVIDERTPVPETGRFDVILLPGTLETADDPAVVLGQVRGLLAADGKVMVILNNAGSSCFTLFGGRHWSGYQRPGVRQQLTPAALQRLTKNAGLRTTRLGTRFASEGWLNATRNWLRDWGAGRALTGLLTGPWLLPQLIATLLEVQALARGRGALLTAELELP